MIAIEEARVELDRHAFGFGRSDDLIFILLERCTVGPMSENRRNEEVPDDLSGLLFDRFEQRFHIKLPRALGTDVIVERDELRVVEVPIVVGTRRRMLDREKVHRADHRVGAHRVNDVLCVRAAARIVVELGADREVHPAAQTVGDDGRVRDLDAGGLGCPIEVAGLSELERAADEIDGGGVFEGQVIHVVGDHHESREPAPAGMIEPKEEHPR